MKNIINLTPHEVTLMDSNNNIIQKFPSSGIVRLTTTREKVGGINGITVNKTIFGKVEGLPEYKENTYYIVSAIVANALTNRDDLIIPDDTVRNDKGQIIGRRSFAIV